MIQDDGINCSISIHQEIVLVYGSVGGEGGHCSHDGMELLIWAGCQMSQGTIVVPVDGDFIVVGRVDGV